MVCPYNNFKPCLMEQCPAFYRKKRMYDDPGIPMCSYVTRGIQPPNGAVNNYYYNMQEEKS